MNDSLDKVLKTVERISFTIIAFVVAAYLISTASNITPEGYGRTLLEGLSVFFVIGGIILLIWVVYNSINYGHPERAEFKQGRRGQAGKEKE